jgi:hypothetical protein
MKNILALLILGTTTLFAQVPQGFNYQAALRDAAGAVLSSQPVSVKIELLQGAVTYTEVHNLTTNAVGLINLTVGYTPQSGGTAFSDINWNAGGVSMTTSYDPAGGTNWTLVGTSILQSVPYALSAANGFSGDFNDLTNVPSIDTSSVNELQSLSATGDTIKLSQGGSVYFQRFSGVFSDLTGVPTIDTSNTNEIQNLSRNGDTLLLSNGGMVIIPLSLKAEEIDDLTDGKSFGTSLGIGSGALQGLTSNTASNTAVGIGALQDLGTNTQSDQHRNTALGTAALYRFKVGSNNIGIGNEVGAWLTGGVNNVILGGAGAVSSDSVRVINDNVILGYDAASKIANGSNANTVIGRSAMSNFSEGFNNIAIGQHTAGQITKGNSNVFIGGTSSGQLRTMPVYSNVAIGGGTGSHLDSNAYANVFIGENAGNMMRGGSDNTAIGHAALQLAPKGGYNVAIGTQAMQMSDVETSSNTAVGTQSLVNVKSSENTAIGKGAQNQTTTGGGNTSVGASSLNSNTTGSHNVAMGVNSLYNNTTGFANTSMGTYSLNSNQTGQENVAVGFSAMSGNLSGSSNTAVGLYTLYGYEGLTGSYNTALGAHVLTNTKSGQGNTGIGYWVFPNLKAGSYNIGIGNNVGLNVRGASENILIGHEANVKDTMVTNSIAIGYQAVAKSSNAVQLGNSTTTTVSTNGRFEGKGGSLRDSSTLGDNAILRLSSNTKGLLLPRMTQVERNVIPNPPIGLVVYCTDCISGGELQSFNGSIWRSSSFTSVNTLPALNTNAPDFIYADSAQLSIVVLNSGGLTLLTTGVQLALDASFGTSVITFSSPNPTTGTNLANPGSLLPNTTYYYRGFASNALGVAYGNVASLTTLGNSSGVTPPAIIISSTPSANHISINIGGSFISPGTNPILYKGFCYSLTASPNFSNYTSEGANSDNFSSIIGNLLSDTTYFIKAYAATALDTFYSNITSVNTTVASQFYVGQLYNGGVIFYVDSTGSHGLIASTNDLGRYQWGCQGNFIDSTQSGLGYGEYNSTRISANCYSTSPTAASACLNAVISGYGDWYLPSYNELQLLKTNLYNNGYTQYFGTDEGSYWSSTEISATQAMQLEFYFGGWYVGTPPGKTNQRKVHPIRSF